MNKKIWLWLVPLYFAQATAAVVPAPEINAKAYLIEDVQSGQILSSEDIDTRIEPASLTKLMTAYLTFKALKEGQIQGSQMMNVSQKAWKMEGSRMFVDPRTPVSVDDLIKGMIVQSGNDACVVLAEGIAGSESGFVALMNAEAQRMGMNNTHFTNTTGLPDAEHYTTVRDLSILTSAIIEDFPEYYPIYSIKSFTYNKIKQNNRNKLLFRDKDVDGVKTGHTSSAGYNLIASSHRNQRRVLSVVIGTNSENARAEESAKLLNWSLSQYETPKMYDANKAIVDADIYKGKQGSLKAGFQQDIYVTVPKGKSKEIEPVLTLQSPLVAPIKQGQKIGTVAFRLPEGDVAQQDILALESVEEAGFFGRLWDGFILWVKSLF